MPPTPLALTALMPFMFTACQHNPTPIHCPPVASFPVGDWDKTEAAFAEAPVLEFAQSWRPEPETDFREGNVRIGWRGDRFLFLADLTDEKISTQATARNQPLWQLGDVLEFFGGAVGNPAYIEYHTAPNGCILQLRWPDEKALRSGKGLEMFMVRDDLAVAQVRRTQKGWQVYGEIPAGSVPGAATPLAGTTWEVHFGRYDSPSVGGPSVLSSTAKLSKPSFHRRKEWRTISMAKPPDA